MAASFIVVIHFFNTHFRPEKFPMDLSVLTGLALEEHLQTARPDYLERMRQEGKLDQIRAIAPSRKRFWPTILAWFLIIALGLILLAGILLADLGK